MIKVQPKQIFKQSFLLFVLWLFGPLLVFLFNVTEIGAKPVCEAEIGVCAWKNKIVGIKTPNMVASGFKITPNLIVTNRHVAEDHLQVLVRNAEGRVQPAVSLPHNFPADLVLLRLENSQPDLKFEVEITQQKTNKLYVVAFDQGRNGPRVYTPGKFARYPDTADLPQARIPVSYTHLTLPTIHLV